MKVVYPRLEDAAASELLRAYSGKPPATLVEVAATTHPRTHWYATAAARASEVTLVTLQAAVRELAQDFGYPEVPGGRSMTYTRFDQRACTVLHRTMHIVPADAAADGVWSFLSLVVLPDVAFWRWPNVGQREDYERILGRPRNVFRRLWWRAEVLGAEVDGPNERLFEDEAVAIMERPTFGGDRALARDIATAHVSFIAEHQDVSRTELLRDVMKRLRRLTPLIALGGLQPKQRTKLICEVFDQSYAAMKGLA